MILLEADKEVAAWVGKRLGIEDFGPNVTMGFAHNGTLIAGAVFNNYRHPSIEISFAADSPKWATRGNIACLLQYPFVQLGCLRLTAYIKASNTRARTFTAYLGFDQEGYHPHGFPDDDAVSYGLLREKNRWMTLREISSQGPHTH